MLVPATTSAAPPKVLTQDKPMFAVKPGVIGFTGDGTGYLGGTGGSVRRPGRLHWVRYTAHQGRARGAIYLDDCEPSCAEGTFHRRAVKVHVFRVRHGRFTRMTIRYRFRGRRTVDRRALGGSARYHYWGIASRRR